jgi:hypothetical protein
MIYPAYEIWWYRTEGSQPESDLVEAWNADEAVNGSLFDPAHGGECWVYQQESGFRIFQGIYEPDGPLWVRLGHRP